MSIYLSVYLSIVDSNTVIMSIKSMDESLYAGFNEVTKNTGSLTGLLNNNTLYIKNL